MLRTVECSLDETVNVIFFSPIEIQIPPYSTHPNWLVYDEYCCKRELKVTSDSLRGVE